MRTFKFARACLLAILILSTFSVSFAVGERLDWSVMSSGGGEASGSGYFLTATLGQTAAGFAGTIDYSLNQGFWQDFLHIPGFVCGDANGNGSLNALDVTFLINFIYKHGPAPNPLQSGDVNRSGTINALDVTFMINFLYKHGPAPNCP